MKSATKLKTAFDAARRDLDELRDRVSDLKARRTEIEGASASRGEIEKRIDAEIARVRKGGLRVPRLYASKGQQFHAADFDQYYTHNPFELWANLDPERLREALLRGAPESGLAAEERASELQRIHTELRIAETAEEILVREIERSAGVVLPRRPDVSPEVLLAPLEELTA